MRAVYKIYLFFSVFVIFICRSGAQIAMETTIETVKRIEATDFPGSTNVEKFVKAVSSLPDFQKNLVIGMAYAQYRMDMETAADIAMKTIKEKIILL